MILRWLVLTFFSAATVLAQAVPPRVTNFAPRVVRIVADGERPSDGFGFIVGETKTHWYAATAAHVINDAGGKGQKVFVSFHPGTAKAVAAKVVRRSTTSDLAAIEIVKPAGAAPLKGCMHPARNSYLRTPVHFIGRETAWYISTTGSINTAQPDKDLFSFDVIGIRPGTSGAPLLGRDGVLGMVTDDVGLNEGRALDIRAIRNAFLGWTIPWTIPECRLAERGTEEASVDIGPCQGPAGTFGIRGDCNENSATRRDVCTTIPANAEIERIRLFRKWTGTPGWPQGTEVSPNDDCEWCKFVGAAKLSPAENGMTRVCFEFLQWSSHESRTARIQVDYSTPVDE